MNKVDAIRYFETLLTHVDMEAMSGIEASASIRMAIEALKAQLSTDDTTFDTTFGKWISCSERLPEMDGKYLITEVDGCVTCDYFRLENGDWRITFPIAWMPLPEPYTEDRDV